MASLKSVFESNLKHLKIDDSLAKKVKRFTQSFVSKNEDHVKFFGNALIGTPKIIFLPSDKAEWMEEILEIDEVTLKAGIRTVEDVNTSFHVTGDAFNLSIIYLVHAFGASRKVSKRRAQEARVSLLMLLQYKFLTSLMYLNFPELADHGTAIATYASLNKRFSLKVHGSWNALIKARAEDVLSDDSIHRKTLERYDNDLKIVYVLSDMQTRIRDTVKAIVAVFYQVRENDAKILSSSSLTTFDGDEKLTDRQDVYTVYHDSLLTAVNERSSFIRTELTAVVTSAMHTLPPKLLDEALEYIVDNYGHRKADFLEELLSETVLHAISFIKDQNLKLNDLRSVITRIRAVYMSSKSNNEDLLKIRELADRVVDESVSSRNVTVKAACRTGVLLYITLRMLTYKNFE